jgi:hypothetical protein
LCSGEENKKGNPMAQERDSVSEAERIIRRRRLWRNVWIFLLALSIAWLTRGLWESSVPLLPYHL